MRRREFITLLGGVAVSWPVAAEAQQPPMRRIGVLMNRAADDPDAQARITAFRQRLQQLGWTDGSNIQIDTRWGEDDVDRERKGAAELVALARHHLGQRHPERCRIAKSQPHIADRVCCCHRSGGRWLRR